MSDTIIEPIHHQRNNDFHLSPALLITIKITILAVFLYPLVHHTIFNQQPAPTINATKTPAPSKPAAIKVIIKQPSCSGPLLADINAELYAKRALCRPEDVHNPDKHQIPKTASNRTQGEPRGTIVGCIAAGLLLTSLGAACVELYRAKRGGVAAKKPPMSRKCSLADLTVLKHNRKELVRRESQSLMEIAENGAKATGFRPPLYRRCSFSDVPVEIATPAPGIIVAPGSPDNRRQSIDIRRLSIITESQKDSKKLSIGGRARSFDDSPERRHRTRLVHRH